MKKEPYCPTTRSFIAPSLYCSILLALAAPLSAAPPPELITVQQQYEKAVLGPHVTEKAALDTKFIAALTNASTAAKQAGHLDEVLAIRAEQKRLTEKLPIPDDDAGIPEPLKKLRGIYREQLTKIEAQRTANHTALLPDYTGKLKDLEIHLTRADRIEDAMEVKAYRESLTLIPAAAVVPSPATPVVSVGADARTGRTFPPSEDRKVAEWVMSLGCSYWFQVKIDGQDVKTAWGAPKLPEGAIEIHQLHVQFSKPPEKPYKNLDPIAGLQNTRELYLYNMPITDADTEVFASMPKLNHVYIQQNKAKFTGERLGLLKELPDLTRLTLDDCNIDSRGVAAISTLPNLVEILLENSLVTDKDLPELAKLTGLKTLKLGLTKTTVAGLSKLGSLTQLVSLGWTPTPKKAKAEFQQIATALPGIKSFKLTCKEEKFTEDDVAGLAAFTALDKVDMEMNACTTETFAGAARIPTLTTLKCYMTNKVNEESFLALKASQSLEVFFVDRGNNITGACLQHLAAIPTLKTLGLSRCPNIKPAELTFSRKPVRTWKLS